MSTSKRTQLWARVLDDPECAKFLAKHSKEFSRESCVPQPIIYPEISTSTFIADVIKDVMPFDKPEQQELAELYLKMSARKIAEVLGWPRKKVYVRLRNLKRVAFRRWKSRRRKMLSARLPTRMLDTDPLLIALKVKTFNLAGKEKRAYLLAIDNDLIWADENGKAFTHEVQEILNELNEHVENFEILDVE